MGACRTARPHGGSPAPRRRYTCGDSRRFVSLLSERRFGSPQRRFASLHNDPPQRRFASTEDALRAPPCDPDPRCCSRASPRLQQLPRPLLCAAIALRTHPIASGRNPMAHQIESPASHRIESFEAFASLRVAAPWRIGSNLSRLSRRFGSRLRGTRRLASLWRVTMRKLFVTPGCPLQPARIPVVSDASSAAKPLQGLGECSPPPHEVQPARKV